MPSPLTTAGAQFDSAPRYVPLHVNEWWTGLWTNRSALRDAATTYLIQKFYSGARFESLIDGQNMEISPRLTPARRFGNSVYNSSIFPAVNTFYAFRIFNPSTFAETIKVIADTASIVYDATGPSTQLIILNKAAGSTQTSFQSVGDTLYMADGVDLKKLLALGNATWQPDTPYYIGTSIQDSNYNIQTLVGFLFSSGNVTIQVASNVLAVQYSWSGIHGPNTIPVGTIIYLYNTTFTAGNYIPLPLAAFTVVGSFVILSFNLNTPNYGPAADITNIYTQYEVNHHSVFPQVVTFGTSGLTVPSWAATLGALTVDSNQLLWVMSSHSVIDWQPIGPANAPNVANIVNTNAGTAWTANTYYNPSLAIVDSNGNVQVLTTGGTTGSAVPTWNLTTGGTTTDGTAVWTNQGTATRSSSTAYSVGQYIEAPFYIQVYVPPVKGQEGVNHPGYYKTLGPYFDIFQCTTAGTSSAGATSSISWNSGIGTTVQDGTVTWTNQGTVIARTTSASSSSNIGNSQAISLATQIVDSNGDLENISTPGESGGTAPTWATKQGSATADGTVIWTNGGPYSAANTGAWVYGYAFKNSVTGDVSECSPASIPITLAQTSLIAVSGTGDPNYATDGVDTIEIYRSVQGFTQLFFLADIPAPPNGGAWNYVDASPDPPAPTSTLNEFIEADVVGDNAPPPAGMVNLAYYLNRMWGSVGEFSYYSSSPQQSIGVNTDNWPGNNYFQFPSTVTKHYPTASGMLFFTVKGLFISSGVDSNGNPNQPVPLLEDIGLLSVNCFTVNGSLPILFSGDKQFVSLDPSAGVTRVGFPIEDILQNFSPINAYVTWHTKGPDQAAYIADGSGTWYRVCLTPAPETGSYTWSPRAQIVGGMKCVQSIETSPGVQDLLLGPVGSGPILRRDSTTWQDNGVSYPAYLTVGSIVLAQPGQAAEVGFVTTEELLITGATIVSPSVLADEIAGTFETLTLPQNDPPWATPSLSVYSKRWYFSTMQAPAWMRHMQIKFTWPSENYQNELLTWSPVSCLHIDSGT